MFAAHVGWLGRRWGSSHPMKLVCPSVLVCLYFLLHLHLPEVDKAEEL